MKPTVLALVGPTGAGKTRTAIALCDALGAEIVSMDSMQIYRGMDIGTAKPTPQERAQAVHHMIDVADPEEDFSVARYVEMAAQCVDDVLARGKLPIVAGGTGLYIDSLLSGRTFASFSPDSALRGELEQELAEKGGQAMLEALAQMDPEAAQRLHPNDHKRIIRALEVYRSTGKTITQHNRETQAIPPRYDALTIGLAFQDRQAMWRRIDQRVDEMVAAGLEDEVRRLLTSGISPKCTAMQAIGYKEFTQALSGEMTWQEAADVVKLRSRQYAKRQLTWFGRNPNTRWVRWDDPPEFEQGRRASTEYMEEFGIS